VAAGTPFWIGTPVGSGLAESDDMVHVATVVVTAVLATADPPAVARELMAPVALTAWGWW
jgi:hypothetical protein